MATISSTDFDNILTGMSASDMLQGSCARDALARDILEGVAGLDVMTGDARSFAFADTQRFAGVCGDVFDMNIAAIADPETCGFHLPGNGYGLAIDFHAIQAGEIELSASDAFATTFESDHVVRSVRVVRRVTVVRQRVAPLQLAA